MENREELPKAFCDDGCLLKMLIQLNFMKNAVSSLMEKLIPAIAEK